MVSQKVLTSYFTTTEDMQRDKYRSSEDFTIIKDWYESLHDLGMEGIIFHDHLSQGFQDEYRTDQLDFVEVTLGDRTPTDERFYHYENYLRDINPDQVIMTDLFDVEFRFDPFTLMDNEYQLYMGDQSNTVAQDEWLINKFNIQYYLSDISYPENYKGYRVLNDGSIGGNSELIMKLLRRVNQYLDRLPEKLNANMPVWNLVVRKEFEDKEIMHGRPWNSVFTANEEEGYYAIKHK